MNKISLVILGLSLIGCEAAFAAPPVVLTHDTKTVANLMDTDLVKQMNLLDCQLRLEGKSPQFKLVYGSGEIPVPTLAVTKMYDGVFVLLAVRAQNNGMPVTELFIPYHGDEKVSYKPMNSDVHWGVTSNYSITVDQSERSLLKVLRARYGKDRVVSHKEWTGGLEQRAVLLRSHPEPELFINSMDALSAPQNKHQTNIYYVCLADRPAN
jgi:hypothetical protein